MRNENASLLFAVFSLLLLTNIVDSNHNGTLGPSNIVRNQVKLVVDVKWTRGGKLWDLFVAPILENLTHLEQNLLKAEVLVRLVVVGVQNLEHGRGTGSSSTSSRIRELEASNVRDIL